MRDAQKGRKSWLERLTSPPETDATELVTEPDTAPVREQPRAPWAERAPLNRSRTDGREGPAEPSEHPLFRPVQVPRANDKGQPAGETPNGTAEAADDYAAGNGWAPPAEAEQTPAEAATEPVRTVTATAESVPATAPTGNDDQPAPTIADQWEGSDRSVTSNLATPDETARAEAGVPSTDTWQPTDAVDAMDLEPEMSEEERIEDERRQRIAELQHRWLVTQAQLLDDPRDAVREAGLLIGDALQFLTATYAGHRDRIERMWKNDDSLSTDELREIMRRYRALFQHVLSVTRIPGH